jgi:NADPH2:quinone reductase
VHETGAGVYEFHAGDRVMAFHQMMTPHGSYAEYALAWAHTTAKIADKTSFEGTSVRPSLSLSC